MARIGDDDDARYEPERIVDEDGVREELDAPRSDDGFVYFRMVGDRFDGPGMPAESVDQVQRYSELLYEVARLKWIDENPGRVRAIPIRNAFDLRLVSIEPGSAQAVFQMYLPRADQDDVEALPYFLNARDTVTQAIRDVSVEGQLPPTFPRAAMKKLTLFSKTVQPGDALELAAPRPRGVVEPPSDPAVLDYGTRELLKRIDEALDDTPTYQRLEGVITELDGVKGTFELRDLHGKVHVCTLGVQESAMAERVKRVLAADGVTAPDVRVGGVGARDRSGVVGDLIDVDEVEIVRTATEKAMMKKLELLRSLEPGWWGPGTRPPGDVPLRIVESLAPQLATADVHVALAATGDGSIVLEWRRDESRYSAEIETDGGMYLFVDHRSRGEQEDLEVPFNEEVLLRFVRTGVLDD